jgi:hypothetical protein
MLRRSSVRFEVAQLLPHSTPAPIGHNVGKISHHPPASQTYSSVFTLGVATGTTIQTLANNSQYGTLNIESDSFTATNSGATITGNYFMYSHSGCFTLTSSSFANIEFHLNAQSGATLTFNLYGCIYRIA